MLKCIAAIVIYFLVAFLVYALSDVWSGELQVYQASLDNLKEVRTEYRNYFQEVKHVHGKLDELIEVERERIKEHKIAGEEIEKRLREWDEKLDVNPKLAIEEKMMFQELGNMIEEQKEKLERRTPELHELLAHSKLLQRTEEYARELDNRFITKKAEGISKLRFVFEFVLPIFIAGYAILLLFKA